MVKDKKKRRNLANVSNRLIATLVLAVISCIAIIASAASTYTVNIEVDGKVIKVTTSEQSPQVILNQAEIELGEKDKLDSSKFVAGQSAKKGNRLIVRRAINVVINDDDQEITEVYVAGTVADALAEAGVTCRSMDKMNYDSSELLTEGMEIKIQRAFTVDVVADGKTIEEDFLEGTVADVLAKLGITLDEDDEVSPSLTSELRPGNTIYVYRITYKERTETETIKYETITKTSASLYKGTTKVEQEGQNGSKEVTYRDKYVDGKLSKSSKVSETIISKAVNKIVLNGTKIKILSTAEPLSALTCPYALKDGIPTNVIATITGSSTAYTGGTGTASGLGHGSGYVAVNPNEIPYGSQLYVVSNDGKYVYGYCIASDTGSFWKDGRTKIDLYFDTYSECSQWGRRNVTIYVLSWG